MFLRLKVCNAEAHVLTGASMMVVPNRVFLTGGYGASPFSDGDLFFGYREEG